MTDFTERLNLYHEGGMIDDRDVDNVNRVITMFQKLYGIELCEENADMFIAHLCAAYGRMHSGEDVEELSEAIVEEMQGLDSYAKSLEILDDIIKVTDKPLSENEKKYALLHINNLFSKLHDSKDKTEGALK